MQILKDKASLSLFRLGGPHNMYPRTICASVSFGTRLETRQGGNRTCAGVRFTAGLLFFGVTLCVGRIS